MRIFSIWTKTPSLLTPSQVRQQWTLDWCYHEYRTASLPGSQWEAIFPEGAACQHSASCLQLPIAEVESCVKHSRVVTAPSFCSASTNGMEAPPWARTLRILRGQPPLSQLVRQCFQATRSKPASPDATDTTIHWALNPYSRESHSERSRAPFQLPAPEPWLRNMSGGKTSLKQIVSDLFPKKLPSFTKEGGEFQDREISSKQ